MRLVRPITRGGSPGFQVHAHAVSPAVPQAAIHSRHDRSRATATDKTTPLRPAPLTPCQVEILPDLALRAWSRSAQAVIGLAVAGGLLRIPLADTGAPMASATRRDRTPRSALGPCHNGRARAGAVTNGRPRFGGTAGRGPFGSSSWDNADERFRLWSRRSGVRVRSISALIPATHRPCFARSARPSRRVSSTRLGSHRYKVLGTGCAVSAEVAQRHLSARQSGSASHPAIRRDGRTPPQHCGRRSRSRCTWRTALRPRAPDSVHSRGRRRGRGRCG
jgi:hypothetical protein